MPARIAILTAIALLALALNVPLGRQRARAPKFSFRWFLYVHLAIPVIALLRIGFHFNYAVIPLLVMMTVAGQIIGGRLAKA